MRGLWGMHFLNAKDAQQAGTVGNDDLRPMDMGAWRTWAQAAETPATPTATPTAATTSPARRRATTKAAPAGSPSAG